MENLSPILLPVQIPRASKPHSLQLPRRESRSEINSQFRVFWQQICQISSKTLGSTNTAQSTALLDRCWKRNITQARVRREVPAFGYAQKSRRSNTRQHQHCAKHSTAGKMLETEHHASSGPTGGTCLWICARSRRARSAAA